MTKKIEKIENLMKVLSSRLSEDNLSDSDKIAVIQEIDQLSSKLNDLRTEMANSLSQNKISVFKKTA